LPRINQKNRGGHIASPSDREQNTTTDRHNARYTDIERHRLTERENARLRVGSITFKFIDDRFQAFTEYGVEVLRVHVQVVPDTVRRLRDFPEHQAPGLHLQRHTTA
jgi:hypothetical protein